jgi:predicted N-acyltransferase
LSFEIELCHHIKDIPQQVWDDLVGDGCPFLEWTWLDCLEEAGCVGGRSGWTPMHLVVRRNKAIVAVVPHYVKTNSEGEFVYDWSFAELARRLRAEYYPKLVCAVPFTPAQGSRVLTKEKDPQIVHAVAQALRQICKEIDAHGAHVLFPLEDEARVWEEGDYIRRYGVQFHWHNRGYRDMNDFLATFKSKKRNQIKRERAQPSKDGVTINTLQKGEITPEIVEKMYVFYISTVDQFAWGRRYLNKRFFRMVADRFADRLAWVVARDKNGEPIAGAFNVEKGKILYGRYWGATAQLPFLHFNVCYYHGIERCIARGLDTFEPGAGGEHKKARGFDPTITHSAHWFRDARLRATLEPAIAREREAIEEWIASGADDD